MLYCYCVALLLFVLSYVLIVCTVPLPPGVNPIAVDKYILKKIYFAFVHSTETSNFVKYVELLTIWGTISLSMTLVRGFSPLIQSNVKIVDQV